MVDIFNGLQISKVIAVAMTEDMLEGIEQAHQSLDNVLLEIEIALKFVFSKFNQDSVFI